MEKLENGGGLAMGRRVLFFTFDGKVSDKECVSYCETVGGTSKERFFFQ